MMTSSRSLALLLLLAATSVAAQEKRKVMCTLPVLKVIADELAGGEVETVALSRPDQDPHFVDATPSLMKKLREADLFIDLGLQLELWADEIANGSGNPKIMKGGKGRVTASAGIPREEIPGVLSRAEGDVHPEGNPHIWLDPLRVKAIAQNIAEALKVLLPDKVAAVDQRLLKFQTRIDEAVFGTDLVKEAGGRALSRRALDGTLFPWLEEKKLLGRLGGWLKKAEALRGSKVVEYHRTWIYTSKLLGFQIVGSIEPKPGISPTPRHLEALKERIRAAPARLILVENYQDQSTPKALAESTGARAVVLTTQPGAESYFEFFERIVNDLSQAEK